jgi:hypothetical protein
MKITRTMIDNLIMLLDKYGLVHGAGGEKEEFCIQQAVNRVINNDLYGQYSDNPSQDCLDENIRAFGIRMNDCLRSMGRQDRAKILKRFAIAEMGSNMIDSKVFFDRVFEKLEIVPTEGISAWGDLLEHFVQRSGKDKAERLRILADAAADVLKELGTEGSKFLHLVDEPNKQKRVSEACKLGNEIFAARVANFGSASCAVKPKQQKQ